MPFISWDISVQFAILTVFCIKKPKNHLFIEKCVETCQKTSFRVLIVCVHVLQQSRKFPLQWQHALRPLFAIITINQIFKYLKYPVRIEEVFEVKCACLSDKWVKYVFISLRCSYFKYTYQLIDQLILNVAYNVVVISGLCSTDSTPHKWLFILSLSCSIAILKKPSKLSKQMAIAWFFWIHCLSWVKASSMGLKSGE